MIIRCMSREKCIEESKQLQYPTLVISIRTFGDLLPIELADNSIANLIHTEFFEFNDEIVDLPQLHCIQTADAVRIAETVFKYKDKVSQIIVHCDAGISRSAGVAAAISKFFNNDDMIFFTTIYTPNMTCYSEVLFALHEKEFKGS